MTRGYLLTIFVILFGVFEPQPGSCMPFGAVSSAVIRPAAIPAVIRPAPVPAPVAVGAPLVPVRPWMYGVAPHPSNYNPLTYWNNFYYQYFPQGY